MANFTVSTAKHATLAAATVDAVTLSVPYHFVEVKNRATSGAGITFTTDGSVPTSLADNAFIVMPGESLIVRLKGVAVRLISATTDAYSVTGVDSL